MRFSVLVVDDEKMPREILREYLPWEELRVDRIEEAEDGAQALELARQHRQRSKRSQRKNTITHGK